MKTTWNFTMALVAAGLITLAVPPLGAEQSSEGTTHKFTGKSGASGSSMAAAEQGQTKKKRRSSGKQITEERTDEKTKSGHDTSNGSKGSSSKRSEIGSGGSGVTGATGR